MARPVPVCKCFVLCRQVFVDPVRQDYSVVSPVHQIFPARYPAEEQLAVFARWANAHGSYEVEVQLRSLESDVLDSCRMEEPFEAQDPLQVWILPLFRIPLRVPRPGKYEVVLLASGTEVASDTLIAHRPAATGAG